MEAHGMVIFAVVARARGNIVFKHQFTLFAIFFCKFASAEGALEAKASSNIKFFDQVILMH
jgi:hypothetical protein